MANTPTRFIFYLGNPLFIKIAEVICTLGTSGRTYLVWMSNGYDDGPGSSPRYIDFPNTTYVSVLKVASKKDRKASLILEHEYEMYKALRPVQGTIIPEFHGFYSAGFSEGKTKKTYWALEIQYCLEKDNFVPNADFNRKIINALRWLHAAGFVYCGSLDSSHLLADGDSPRLISLSRIHPGHVCPDFVHNGPDEMPLKSIECCSDLAAICGVDD